MARTSRSADRLLLGVPADLGGPDAGPLHFRLTARDGHPAGGGVGRARTRSLNLAPGTGPFLVTSQATPATTLAGLSTQTVTWDVAGTDVAPISASAVKISLSVDGGVTYPYTLRRRARRTTARQRWRCRTWRRRHARIKVEAVGNVFFDISDADFTIQGVADAAARTTLPPGGASSRQRRAGSRRSPSRRPIRHGGAPALTAAARPASRRG